MVEGGGEWPLGNARKINTLSPSVDQLSQDGKT